MTGSDRIRVTPVANAGVLIEYRGFKLLIDGIFSGEGHPFGGIPEDSRGRLFSGRPPYDGIDGLMFTHCHRDHFSAELTLEYLKRNRVKGVFLPEAESHGALTEYIREQRIPCVPLSGSPAGASFSLAPGVSVRVFRVRHLDRRFSDVEHFCFLLGLGEKRLLITGDADYVSESFSQLEGTRLDAVFLNPLFFSALCRRRFFTGSFDCALYCVYHLPFIDDRPDTAATLERELSRWDPGRGQAVLLNRKDRSLEI